MFKEDTPTQFVLSNGILWAYLDVEMVHLFSLGDWLLSYQVPSELSLQNQPNVIDRGNSAVFKYANELMRTISLIKNILKDTSSLSHLYKTKVIFQNSLHFRGWNGLPSIKNRIISLGNNEYIRKGYPRIKITKNEN
ncbi:MAG: hypothetical protein JSV04_05965, partial [Candidatus Heimdallarchaeota archaeon]